MALAPYIIGKKMSGYRTEKFYIEKYGAVDGPKKYAEVIKRRASREMRRESTVLVECCLCKQKFKRITRTHLANSCIEKITTEEYLKRFPSAELVSKELKKLYSNTKNSIIEKYGEHIGQQKWEDYCKIQAYTNTYEYKKEKFNITLEEFNTYNKNRSATLMNFIQRHGEETGIIKWNEYCDRQRYTTSIEYFIEKYGIEEGTKKYQLFCLKRVGTCKTQSAIEISAYNELKEILNDLHLSVRLQNPYYGPYDYGNIEKKKLIEFYGTYWHCDPRFFDSDHFFSRKNQSASQISARDQAKRTYALTRGFEVQIIWEHDWYKNKQQVIENLQRWWNNGKNSTNE